MSEGRQWMGGSRSGTSNNGDGIGVAERVEDRMLTLLKRHQVQTLLAAGHGQMEVALLAGVSVRSVRRIAAERAVEHVDDRHERDQRGIGRPSKVAAFRALVQELVEEVDEETRAPLKSVEILRRARLDGYQGGKSALYELIAELRPHATQLMMRFEELPSEFSQHDFGEVRITYLDGSREVVRFFGSRLKWSRWAVLNLVPNQVAETLIRTLVLPGSAAPGAFAPWHDSSLGIHRGSPAGAHVPPGALWRSGGQGVPGRLPCPSGILAVPHEWSRGEARPAVGGGSSCCRRLSHVPVPQSLP